MESRPSIEPEARNKRNPLDDLRQSFDERNGRSQIHSVNRSSFLKDQSRRENYMSQSTSNFQDLKLTSLKERRSITRGFKFNGGQKPTQSNGIQKHQNQDSEVVIEKIDEVVPQKVDNSKFQTLSLLTKTITGMLSQIEDDESLQLE